MTNVSKWITRSSAALLTAVSVSAFAGGPVAPDYTIHKAEVKLKLKTSVADEIEKETLKNDDMVDILGGDSDNNDHKLVVAVPCGIDEDPDAVGLTVFNDETEAPVIGADLVVFDLLTGAPEFKDGDLVKLNTVAEANALPIDLGDVTIDALLFSGTAKFGKLGNKVTKDTPWSEDAWCAKKFEGKSAIGFLEILGEEGGDLNIESGTISAGKAKAGWDGCLWDCPPPI